MAHTPTRTTHRHSAGGHQTWHQRCRPRGPSVRTQSILGLCRPLQGPGGQPAVVTRDEQAKDATWRALHEQLIQQQFSEQHWQVRKHPITSVQPRRIYRKLGVSISLIQICLKANFCLL